MSATLPLFPISLIGSFPRPRAILQAIRHGERGEAFARALEEETRRIIALQERYGVDLITSGELSRDNYCSFVAQKLGGVSLLSMSEMLEFIEDKGAFEEILTKLNLPGFSIKNALCTGRLAYEESLTLEELQLMQDSTTKPLKITLPGPYLLTRSLWLAPLSSPHYASKEELGREVVAILKREIDRLASAGAFMVQLDEPVLSEVVFTQGKPRSFMCAALSERQDPSEELEFALGLIEAVMSHFRHTSCKGAIHICRGNWSSDESTLLQGAYTPLTSLLESCGAEVCFLEFSTPRAGEIDSLFKNSSLAEKITLGLGVLNPRIPRVESAKEIVARAKEALRYLPKERLWLNPDCGFATFANHPLNSEAIIESKLAALHEAASELRAIYG